MNIVKQYLGFFFDRKLWYNIAIIGLVIFLLWNLYKLYREYYNIETFSGEVPDGMVQTLSLELSKKNLQELNNSAEFISTISEKIEKGEALTPQELQQLNSLYQSYIEIRKTLNAMGGELLEADLATLQEFRTMFDTQTEKYRNLMDSLSNTGYAFVYDEQENLISIHKVETIQPKNDDELDQFLHQQLIKRIQKLQKINNDNIKYYKTLNEEQQELLLGIIDKRNKEIERLLDLLSKLEKKVNNVVAEVEEIEEKRLPPSLPPPIQPPSLPPPTLLPPPVLPQESPPKTEPKTTVVVVKPEPVLPKPVLPPTPQIPSEPPVPEVPKIVTPKVIVPVDDEMAPLDKCTECPDPTGICRWEKSHYAPNTSVCYSAKPMLDPSVLNNPMNYNCFY